VVAFLAVSPDIRALSWFAKGGMRKSKCKTRCHALSTRKPWTIRWPGGWRQRLRSSGSRPRGAIAVWSAQARSPPCRTIPRAHRLCC